mmetsp:Transcript_13366/g.46260  ORF Transcript_13366/g.46260 Transcript_13366/m.46260 type:complete len:117 (-) Transcript_13366:1488-1838(-)
MASLSRIVLRRCAIVMDVRPCDTASSSFWISRSVCVSSAEVASSSTRMGGSLSSARAMATLCFSPPLSLRPRSPTTVSKPSGWRSMKGLSFAAPAAATTSSRLARSPEPSLPKDTL